MHCCPCAAGAFVCPAASVHTLAVSEDGSWVAGLGHNGHGQQFLMLWEVHGLQRTCKVSCAIISISILTQSVQCCSL